MGHPAPCKASLSGLYSTESIKIQHHAVTLPPNCWLELGHPAPCKYPCLGYNSTESIKIKQTLLLEFGWFEVVMVSVVDDVVDVIVDATVTVDQTLVDQ